MASLTHLLQTIFIHELDRQLAEARAITMATMRGFRFVKVLERERVSGAWRFVVDLL